MSVRGAEAKSGKQPALHAQVVVCCLRSRAGGRPATSINQQGYALIDRFTFIENKDKFQLEVL
jgi:hypothetical protein